MATQSRPYQPIAIVGIGCRFPGGVASPSEFWTLLTEQVDGTSEVPADRWSIEKYYDPDPKRPGKLYTKRGGFISGISEFDPQFFGISPREVAYVDPQHRMLLETTWEAFEDAGIAPRRWSDRKVGVFVGLFTHDYENIHMRVSERGIYGPHSATGMSTTIAANRLSHAFGFTGPSMVIDTACSSSLVALHLACRSLHEGESELAIAGGVNLQLSPEMTMSLCKASMLSPDGRCKSFDARANGYARADGVGMVVLKTLERAQADGDQIYAVIMGSAVNQDGRTQGLTVPNGDAQQVVMRDALSFAGVHPSEISYIEAHGTGTAVGDPIETNALGTVLRSGNPDRAPCVIGSVKSNFGHTESAAGIAGLIKVALMQRHGYIPPNLHFETPNPNIPFEDLRLRVPTALEEWRTGEGGRRLAGINSFGFGGTNAHVVLANAPGPQTTAAERSDGDQAHLVLLSARSDEALKANARRHGNFLRSDRQTGVPLADVSAALALGRDHHPIRLAVAGRTASEVADLLDGFAAGQRRQGVVSGQVADAGASGVVFVCSGMGQQWWAMGRGLLDSEPVFARKIDELDRMFGRLARWSLRDILSRAETDSQIDRTEYAQPAIFGLQMGLAALWESWGVKPDLVVGHSVGEVAAACIAGALTLEDAVTVCFHRSRLQATLAGRGGMLAVGLPEADLARRIQGKEALVSIAAVNSAESATLAGDTATLQQIEADLQREAIFARMLNVEVPYHSPVMDEIREPFRAALQGIAPRASAVPLVSTVTGQLIDGTAFNADYWNRNVREPVAFAKAIGTLAGLQGRVFIEIGAHPVLASSIGECLTAAGVQGTVIASLRRKHDDATTFMAAVGQLHCLGHRLALEAKFARPSSRLDLPLYPWQRSTFWAETADSRKLRTGLASDDVRPDHPLLGERQAAPQPAWSNEIDVNRPHYLKDHAVQGAVVFPAAGFIEMALAAARETVGAQGGPLTIERLSIEAPLVLSAGSTSSVQLTVGDGQKFQIHSHGQQEGVKRWTRHVAGTLIEPRPTADAQFLDAADLHDRLSNLVGQDEIYRRFDTMQLQYGPLFQNLHTAWVGDGEALGQLVVPPAMVAEIPLYNLHPALLDATFQLLVALPAEGTFLPVGVERVEVIHPGVAPAWAYVRKVSETKTRIVADLIVADEQGRVLARLSGLACQAMADAGAERSAMSGSFLFDRVWVDSDLSSRSVRQRASALPAPRDLAPGLQTRHDRRDADARRERFVLKAWPALDELASDYFINALTNLGWNWQAGIHFTAADLSKQLDIASRHVRFVERMLMHLVRSGHLEVDGGRWHVRQVPAIRDTEAQWRALSLAYPECHAELNLTRRCGFRLAQFLRDEEEPLSALFPVGSPIAEHMYADSPTCGPYNRIIADSLDEIVRKLPEGQTLRILEVGAGTGGLTSHLLPLLPAEKTDYVYTDVSQSFLNHAKDRFRAFPFVRYEIFDVEHDPEAQGLVPGFFDLIVICDAVHATAHLRTSIGNLHDLLAPGGMLALMEVTSPTRWYDLVFGLLPGWWAFTDRDLRPDHATLPAAGWLSVLALCGFDEAVAVSDGISAGQESLQTVFFARRPDHAGSAAAVLPAISPELRAAATETPVVLLADAIGVADGLAAALRALGTDVSVVTPGLGGDSLLRPAILAAGGVAMTAPAVVDMRNLSQPGGNEDQPSNAGTLACENLRDVVRVLAEQSWRERPDLWIVTNGAESVGGLQSLSLHQAQVRGFARVVTSEHAELNTRLADLSPVPGATELAALARLLIGRGAEDDVALRGDHMFFSRVIPHRNRRRTDGETTGFRITRERRAPDGLVFRETAATPPGPGQVQVQMRASGLNYKDFARQVGLLEAGSDSPGLEGAGVVVAVGPGVDRLAPGDNFVGLIDGSLSNPINADARLLVRMPANLSFEDAAGLPVVFLTAYQALKRQARIAPGEAVLVHTAAGGLGLAEIQVARALGARVFATAGNAEKRDYLHALGIDYVGDSRTTHFADEILAATGGRGVDVILNTLSAEMNRDNLRLLRPGSGRLVDLRNMHYGAQLDYAALQSGVMFSAFDLGVMAAADHDYMTGLLEEIAPLFENDTLRPVPYRSAPVERIGETIRSFRKAAHIGKFVATFTDSTVDMAPAAAPVALTDQGIYLISGGLSGFGLSTARWLASNGARHLVLVGRRGAATPEAQDALADLRAAGVHVETVAADVSDAGQVEALVRRFGSEWPRLHGIVHAAMVLRDGPILGMTSEHIQAVLRPKVDGAWNLHRFTLDQPLDFFVCYSSLSALVGNRDQANYAAANEYLEAICRHRRANGLPAVSISWGAIADIGYVARDEGVRDVLRRQGAFDLKLEQAWIALSHGLRAGVTNLYAASMDWTTLKQFSRTVSTSPRFQFLGASTASPGVEKGATSESESRLDGNATPEERYRQLQIILAREVSGVLGTDPDTLDLNRPLQSLGFDSLMAVELTVAIERATGYGFSRMSLLRADATTAELVREIAEVLGARAGETAPESDDAEASPQPAKAQSERRSVDELNDNEVDALLRELVTEEMGNG
ncbi:SDR family NAD(P)-dependent oxidoreductase [Phreatobacter sp. HK31-P]